MFLDSIFTLWIWYSSWQTIFKVPRVVRIYSHSRDVLSLTFLVQWPNVRFGDIHEILFAESKWHGTSTWFAVFCYHLQENKSVSDVIFLEMIQLKLALEHFLMQPKYLRLSPITLKAQYSLCCENHTHPLNTISLEASQNWHDCFHGNNFVKYNVSQVDYRYSYH